MASQVCPHCASELTFEAYGVMRCAKCGRMDVDGKILAEGETPATELNPRGGFVAPPPSETPAAKAGEPLPGFLLLALGLRALIDALVAFDTAAFAMAAVSSLLAFCGVVRQPWGVFVSVTSVFFRVFWFYVWSRSDTFGPVEYILVGAWIIADVVLLVSLSRPATLRHARIER